MKSLYYDNLTVPLEQRQKAEAFAKKQNCTLLTYVGGKYDYWQAVTEDGKPYTFNLPK